MRALRRLADPSATPWYAVALMFGFLLNAWSFAPVHVLAVLRTFVLGTLTAALLTVVVAALLRHRAAGGLVAALLVGGLLGWGGRIRCSRACCARPARPGRDRVLGSPPSRSAWLLGASSCAQRLVARPTD
jgi:hypothetical protein